MLLRWPSSCRFRPKVFHSTSLKHLCSKETTQIRCNSSQIVCNRGGSIPLLPRHARVRIQEQLPFPKFFKYQLFSSTSTHSNDNMDAKELKNFLADSPPSVVRLEIKPHFEALNDKEQRYAHYISRYVHICQKFV